MELYAFEAKEHHYCIFTTAEKSLEYLERNRVGRNLKDVRIFKFQANIPMFEQNIEIIYESKSDDQAPTHKCVACGEEINIDYFKDYEVDDCGDFWCISCAEEESDTGEVY